MTPAEEAALLRRHAEEIAEDTRLGQTARLITCAVLEGRAARVERGEIDHPRPRNEAA